MILVRLDPDANATTVLSIPRDLKVDFTVPGAGLRVGAKINETYTDGGEVLTAKVIRRLLRIPINHIVNINFKGFRKAVDAIGCVYVDVDKWYYHSNLGGGRAVRGDRRPGRLPETVRQHGARLRALPPRRQRLRPRGAPAGLPAPGEVAVRRRPLHRRSAPADEAGRPLHAHGRVAAVEGGAAAARYLVALLGEPPDPRGALPGRIREPAGRLVRRRDATSSSREVRHEFLAPPPKEPKAKPAAPGEAASSGKRRKARPEHSTGSSTRRRPARTTRSSSAR